MLSIDGSQIALVLLRLFMTTTREEIKNSKTGFIWHFCHGMREDIGSYLPNVSYKNASTKQNLSSLVHVY